MSFRVLGASLLVACGVIVLWFFSSPSTPEQQSVSPVAPPAPAKAPEPVGPQTVGVRLDLREEVGSQEEGGRLVVPAKRLHATIVLPEDSAAGDYDVQVRDPRGRTVTAVTSRATADESVTLLRTTLDLTAQVTGSFRLAIRPASGAWRFHDLVVQ